MKQKTRFDGLDVAAMTAQVRQTLLGNKVANIYDGMALSTSISGDSSGKSTFVFKLANPSANKEKENDGNTSASRNMLLIESGVRFHTTSFYTTSDNNSVPSPFAMKLRKHLRNLRLENITQLGNLDRVVDFRFGSGEKACHLILELYGMGNLILTDNKYLMLALLRTHEYVANKEEEKDAEEEVKVRVGNVYPVTYATTITKSSTNDENKEESMKKYSILDMNGEEAYQWTKSELQTLVEKQAIQAQLANTGGGGKKKGKKKKDLDGSATLKMMLLKPNSGVFHYGPSLIEHCILSAGLEPTTKFTLDTIEEFMPPQKFVKLIENLQVEGSQIIENFTNGESKGYVLYKEKTKKDADVSEVLKNMPHSDKMFEEFQPHLLKQHANKPYIEYANFSMAVDEFFSLIEGQKRAIRAEAAEQSAIERLDKIKKDQSKRMEGLEVEMEKVKESAQLIEMHADDVDKAIGVINSALESGMDWDALEELVTVEKSNLNPIALLMKKLMLDKDEITLSLPDTMNWDQDTEDAPTIKDVTVSLKESAYGNARQLYDKYRISKDKAEKTVEASEKVLQAAEANAKRQIEEAQKKKKMSYSTMMSTQRKQHWFEKFIYFITSDNYLCIGGRDAQQNEQLVKRYLRPGDAYLHADVHGAPTCILRAKRRRTESGATEVLPLSDQALREAGNFAICRSSAWGARMVTSAWWVESHQVSKTAPTGEYLSVGGFMIRGKKNFLPPVQLEMGMGVLFRLGDEASVARHHNERRDFALMALEQAAEERAVANEAKTEFQPKQEKLPKKKTTETSKPKQSKKSEGTEGTKKQNKKASDSSSEDKVTEAILKLEITNEKETPVAAPSDSVEEIPKKKKGLSAKERKLIKKYGSLEAAEEILAKVRKEEEEAKKRKAAFNAEKEESKSQHSEASTANTRGKKAKLKKKAKKYADQDAEDRELALMALQGGSKTKKKKGGRNIEAESESQLKAASEAVALLVRDSKKVVEKLAPEIQDLLAKIVTVNDEVRWNKLDAEVLENLMTLEVEAQKAAAQRLLQLSQTSRVDNFSASLAGIIRTVQKYGHQGLNDQKESESDAQRGRKTKAEKEAEKEAWREILAEDGIIEDDGEGNELSVDDTAEISKLTGKPMSDDVILYAIPVCAPYSTLAQYKYRVKLTPGNLKRGKASKQCLEMILRSEEVKGKGPDPNQRYLDMIKNINDNEWVQAMCGDVKISAAGASKAIKKSKASKKNKAKKTK